MSFITVYIYIERDLRNVLAIQIISASSKCAEMIKVILLNSSNHFLGGAGWNADLTGSHSRLAFRGSTLGLLGKLLIAYR